MNNKSHHSSALTRLDSADDEVVCAGVVERHVGVVFLLQHHVHHRLVHQHIQVAGYGLECW